MKIPNELIINENHYTFKKKLAGDKYSYRCIYRNECKTLLTISKADIEKIKSKSEIKIDPKINIPHTCKGNIIENTNGKEVKLKKTI